jgi:AcrR family transcriptional regulator
MGSLRHYFATQSELIAFALQVIIDRIEARIAAIDTVSPRRRAELVLAELLPMDANRRAENEVWLAYTARASVDPELRALQNIGYDKLLEGCGIIVRELAGDALTPAEVDLETERLHALVDGLAVHAAMRPDLNSPERLESIITRHLDELENARR